MLEAARSEPLLNRTALELGTDPLGFDMHTHHGLDRPSCQCP